jgi:four helix bundle protein
MEKKNHDLQERLIEFTICCIYISEKLPRTNSGNYYSSQLVRSSGSVSLNYGEVQSAESRKDFIHKVKVVLKELRETNINLTIIYRKPFLQSNEVNNALIEVDELISIFVSSINTARKKKTINTL